MRALFFIRQLPCGTFLDQSFTCAAWGGKGLWEAAGTSAGAGAMPWLLRPALARNRRGRRGEPGSFTLPGHSFGWGLCRRHRGSARAPEGAHPTGDSGARTSSWGPIGQQDLPGEGWSSFCQQGQGPAKLCHLCAFCPRHGCGREVKQTPCRVSGPGAGESS